MGAAAQPRTGTLPQEVRATRASPANPRFQVSELSLLGCYRASRGLAQLSNLVQLDLQPGLVMNGGWLWVNACWPVCVA